MLKMHQPSGAAYGRPPKNTFFYPDDGDGGTPPPAADAANDGDGAGGSETAAAGRTFTQAEVDRLLGDRAARAEETATKRLLSKFKFEKAEDLETFVSNARQKADSELSEQERLKAQLEQLTPQAAKAAELEAQIDRYNEEVKKRVEAEIKALNIPTHFTELLSGMDPLAQLEYINKHRDSFTPKPAPPNLNGGAKGGGSKNADKLTAVRKKYGIRRTNRS